MSLFDFVGPHLAGVKQSETARSRRRAYPIHMYTGRNGSGKTLAAVYDTLPELEAGMHCLSTVRLLDYNNPRPCDDSACEDLWHGKPGHMAAHPRYVPFRTWPQLLDWPRPYGLQGPVLMDEITGVADSNESAGLPHAAGNKLAQLRRDDCSVRITGLSFIRANKRIREAVVAVTRCQSSMPVDSLLEDGSTRLWRARRLAKWTTYDAQSLPMDDHTEHAYDTADKLVSGRHWIPTSPAITAYDTYSPVLMVGTVTDSGRCAHCGGNRKNPECSCADYQAAKPIRRSAGAQAREAAEHRRDAVRAGDFATPLDELRAR